ncbi:hypothetical protein ACQ5SP_09655 [Rhodovulum sp. YNF3179]|uniref:hypothetical protein n=1 Tax=Rhodovulum sp. YNF3179 TaxID=3425127 RepID=UPI003D3368A8
METDTLRPTSRGLAALAALALATAVVCGGQARAEEPLLTITAADGAAGAADLTRADLVALRQVTFETGTIWTEEPRSFTGPPLSAVLDAAGAAGGEIRLVALNDYAISIPMSEIGADYPIVAHEIDGAPFPVRQKGPLWVVYPYDQDPAYQSEVVYGRSIWQLREITVQP